MCLDKPNTIDVDPLQSTTYATTTATAAPDYCTDNVSGSGIYVCDINSGECLSEVKFTDNFGSRTQYNLRNGEIVATYDGRRLVVPDALLGGALAISGVAESRSPASLHCSEADDGTLTCFNYAGQPYEWYMDGNAQAYVALTVPDGYTAVSPFLY